MSRKKVLLTFIGDNDCKLPHQSGAILNLLHNENFERFVGTRRCLFQYFSSSKR